MRKLAVEIDHRTKLVIRVLTQVCLGALIVFYTVAVFMNRELGLLDKVERPLILTALLLIIMILTRIEHRLPGDDATEVTVYADRTSFYEATRKAIENAQRRVYVTYFRTKSPTELDEAVQRHFKACRKWANSSPDHAFRRILINSDNPSMADYLHSELAEVVRARTNKRHYNVRLLDNVSQDAGAISMGIYDDDQVFISYASGTDRIAGIRIRSREVVRECFDHYYDHLWAAATEIDKHAASRRAN
ncbi:hypothetical protein [Saccharothrix sp.]|uniref:hypothetical protein n=1 Tax=Saccharothrix sp. TaxID=1873460 RepID=UPI00281153CE|nr:hypothetical protein [Saccharothrix sp.]